eukprot:403334247
MRNLSASKSMNDQELKKHNFNAFSPLRTHNNNNQDTNVTQSQSFRDNSPFQAKRSAAQDYLNSHSAFEQKQQKEANHTYNQSVISTNTVNNPFIANNKQQKKQGNNGSSVLRKSRTPIKSQIQQSHTITLTSLAVPHTEYKQLLTQFQNLSKNNDKTERQLQQAQKESLKYRTLNEQNEKELRVLQQTLQKLKEEKLLQESDHKSLKEYSRKLESRLIQEVNKAGAGNVNSSSIGNSERNGNAGGPLQDIIQNQREQLNKIRGEKDKADAILESMYQKLQQQQQENQNLTVALEMKFQDVGIKNFGGVLDREQLMLLIKSEQNQQQHEDEKRGMLMKIQDLNVKVQSLTAITEELKIIRESNNLEFIRLEQEIHYLSQKNQSLALERDTIQREKSTLLDFIEELNSNHDKRLQQLQDELKQVTEMNSQQRFQLDELFIQVRNKQQESDNFRQECDKYRYQSSQSEHEYKILKEELITLKNQITNQAKNSERIISQEQIEGQLTDKKREILRLESETLTLKDRLQSSQNDNLQLRGQIEAMLGDIRRLEHNLNLAKRHDQQRDGEIQDREKLIREISELRKELDDNKRKNYMLQNESQSHLQVQKQLEDKNSLIQKQVENLIASKKLLQKTLSEQMNIKNKKIDF